MTAANTSNTGLFRIVARFLAIQILLGSFSPFAHADKSDDILGHLGEISPAGQEAQGRLYELKPDELRTLIHRGLRSGTPQARRSLMRAISDLKLNDLLPELKAVARNDADWKVVDEAMLASRELEGDGAADFLRAEANNKSARVQFLAIRYLASYGFPEDTDLFKKKLNSREAEVRLAAARALIHRGEHVDRALVIPLINESTPFLRNDAIELVGETGNIEDSKILEKIVQDPATLGSAKIAAQNAIYAIQLRQLPTESRLDFLREKLNAYYEETQSWAAFKLLEVPGGPSVLEKVVADPRNPARPVAQHALKSSRSPQWRRLHKK